ncbi:putative bifunctional diguanylate cyclase/phosphodiesterase [Luteimonas terrae]|uniref:Diguanylate cyclase (GGDEF)-like protein/PAS domain S-box-containing protein n=1 Tax=Luteimonas terrae TaxID=1530191 RepID=A0ABU1XU01_9GAMM|nr:EAL domain-containing protein [Luteimonas terrae]MDR7192240.1 diguanylate cyclase (GGDEF)-like protein/PAS domain S-box-containing protein [Luteimonas terrae]
MPTLAFADPGTECCRVIEPSQLHVPGAAVLIALLVLLVVLLIRRRSSERAYVAEINDHSDRLKLALWASGERYWDYDIGSGQLRRLVDDAPQGNGRMLEDSMPVDALLHPDDLDLAREALGHYLDGESGRYQVQLRVTDGAGGWIWVRVRGRAVERDEAGDVRRIAGTALNVSATREAERERQIAATVLRSMGEAVAVLDADFRYVSVNPAFLRMTGYPEAEVLGRGAALLDSEQNDSAFYRRIRAQARREGHWSGELWQRRKDGEELLAALELRTVRDADDGSVLHVCVLNDITQQKRTEQELRYLANFDTLTGLPNRSLLSERLSRAIVRAHREDSRLAVLFLDLDRFKDVNDSLGHAAGDRILRAAAVRLQQTVGAQHTVARLGGDEFTVVLEGLDRPDDAEYMAREIINAFGAPLSLDDRREVSISPSIGISLYPDHAQVPTELLKQADTAMYQAKAAGRCTFMRYNDDMDLAVRQRATISGALRKVLDRGELRLVFQPRLSLSPPRITGVEALLRWSSPEHGDIPPAEFIPIAEESGLILEIGEWVLREACLVLQRWRQHGMDTLNVSVNVSVLQLLRGDFVGVVARVLDDVGIPPHLLELELTESVLMANAEQTAERLQAFRTLGVSLAIDDFGTGYSSLAYLKRLPITTIKIDKAFVDGLPHDAEDAAITPTIVAMAHSLGLRVVAEGVETEGQMRFLAERGCDEIQGFWVSPPLDALQCLAFMRNWRPGELLTAPHVPLAVLP